jgi:BirA family biotin operon repressor/biotin-[acetyl-CoA-carboxylase] ligase
MKNRLNASELASGLKTKWLGKEIHCLDTVDSTNSFAKKLAYKGCSNGTVVTAERQTSGRGRLGRAWHSPDGAGIWMSIVLRTSMPPGHIQGITLAASVAVVNAVNSIKGVKAGIKWPNDIILGDKKVCGILTEMSCGIDGENFAVTGIGINVSQSQGSFTGELEGKAVSLASYLQQYAKGNAEPVKIKRSNLIIEVLLQFEQVLSENGNINMAKVIEEWKEHSVTLGKEVRVISPKGEYTGTAEDITPDGRLVLKRSDGSMNEILSGEVSIRGIMGY